MRTIALTLSLVLCLTVTANATLVVTFADGGVWDGAGTGDTIGPMLDPMTNESGTVTIGSITDSGVFAIGGTTDTNAPLGYGMGVFRSSATPDDPELFNVGESGSFSWSVPTDFAGITFRPNFQMGTGAQTGTDEMMEVSSTDWVGLSRGALGANVTFNSATGTFTFTSDGSSTQGSTDTSTFQSFDDADLGGAAPLSANTVLTITKIGTDIPDAGSGTPPNLTSGAGLHDMSFNVYAVPEASQVLLGSLLCGVFGLGYGRRKWLAREKAA